MATRGSPHTMFPGGPTGKTTTRVSTLCNTQMIQPNRTAVAALVKYYCSTAANKVYEDLALGILCYQDEHGEVICEGLDEGPRHSRWASPDTHQEESLRKHRDVQIPAMPLQKSNETNREPNVLCINGLAANALDKQ